MFPRFLYTEEGVYLSMDFEELPPEDEAFIIEHAVEGYTASEISYLLKEEKGSMLAQSTVEDLLESEYGARRVELKKSIQEKKADVSRDELVADLKDVKDTLISRAEYLRRNEMDDISNDTVSNLISNIKLLGEYIGELQSRDDGSAGTININKLEQNFNISQAIKFMPPEDKKSLAEQLAEDEDVEDFLIIRKDDDEEEDEEGAEDEENEEEDVEEEKVEA